MITTNYTLVFTMLFFIGLIFHMISFSKNKKTAFFISNFLFLGFSYVAWYGVQDYVTLEYKPFFWKLSLPCYILTSLVSGLIYFVGNTEKKPTKEGEKEPHKFIPFELQARKRNIKFFDKIASFLVYAGTGTGKTKSVGRPLLKGYIQNQYAGFIYDMKEYDYTKAAHHLISTSNYPYSFYYTNFEDLSRAYRFNPISPSSVALDDLPQLAEDLIKAYLPANGKLDDWALGGLGILQGVMIRFYKDHPKLCTLPHILNFAIHNSNERILSFLEKDTQARALAGAFFDAQKSEKQMAGYKSSLTNYIGKLAYNKNICYILSGDDFTFNLIDPKEPKLFAIANSYSMSSILGPICGMLVKISSRKFTMNNKIPFVYVLDEATTFKIDDFEGMTSVLREYLCAFLFLTQSSSKIRATYGRDALNAIESNFGNTIIGRTGDIEAQERYVKQFQKIDITKKTHSRSSGGHNATKGESRRIDREYKYEPADFNKMLPGEFVGNAMNSNYKEFHLQLNMLDIPKDKEVPVVRNVTTADVDRNYDTIISTIKTIT